MLDPQTCYFSFFFSFHTFSTPTPYLARETWPGKMLAFTSAERGSFRIPIPGTFGSDACCRMRHGGLGTWAARPAPEAGAGRFGGPAPHTTLPLSGAPRLSVALFGSRFRARWDRMRAAERGWGWAGGGGDDGGAGRWGPIQLGPPVAGAGGAVFHHGGLGLPGGQQ